MQSTLQQAHALDKAKVGDGATYTIYSDSQAGTIIEHTGTRITWQRDKATLLNGSNSGAQRYAYERDPKGAIFKFSRRVLKSGAVRWVLTRHHTRSPGCSLSAGRNEHYDFNF